MALPKRQHSKQRGRKRRTHWKIKLAGMGPCSHCGAQVLSHRVCPYCGHYKGKPVVEIKVKEKKKEQG